MGAAVLHVVATPIGNLGDLTPRAVEVLQRCSVVFAEDTRRSRGLFAHAGIATPLESLHEHNERARSQVVLARLGRGEEVALISDAGTPAVSDPGALLVAQVAAAGYRVSPVPGASSLAAALSVCGFVAPDQEVSFFGFLPVSGRERAEQLERIGSRRGVVVLLEAPHRALETLVALARMEPDRPACVCRELTKVHEEVLRGSLTQLAEWAAGEVRGELTLVLGPSGIAPVSPGEAQVDAALKRCLASGLSARDAATAVAAVLELPRRQVYQRCLALGASSGGEGG